MISPIQIPLRAALCTAVALAALPASAFAQEAPKKSILKLDPAPKGDAGKADPKEQAKDNRPALALGKVLPLNRPSIGVRLPGYEKGKLTSFIEARQMTRVDDENLDIVAMVIQLMDADEKPDMVVDMKTAVYHMPNGLLFSNDRTVVTNKDYTIVGAAMEFDTRTKLARMKGPVKAVFKNLELADEKGDAGKQKPSAGPASNTTNPNPKESDESQVPIEK